MVCDTSVLLHLTEADALPVLIRMGDIAVPRAVVTEMTQYNPLWLTEKPSWIDVHSLTDSLLKEATAWCQAGLLDSGEAEAIALARQIKAAWFLTDDAAARLFAQSLKETETAARNLGLTTQHVDVRTQQDIDPAFQAAVKGRADAVLVLVSVVLNSYRKQVVVLAAKNRIPTIYPIVDFVEAGGLMSYGVSFVDLHRRAAIYVDKILRGAKPANLPVEQPTKFEFVINLQTAKQISLTIPPNVLARADRVIR